MREFQLTGCIVSAGAGLVPAHVADIQGNRKGCPYMKNRSI
ncbi:hypothetical protein ACFL1R_03330 [Candidatus Latescibacterota bacterium]